MNSPEVSWELAQEHGWFSMAADLIERHAALLAAGARSNVIQFRRPEAAELRDAPHFLVSPRLAGGSGGEPPVLDDYRKEEK